MNIPIATIKNIFEGNNHDFKVTEFTAGVVTMKMKISIPMNIEPVCCPLAARFIALYTTIDNELAMIFQIESEAQFRFQYGL